MSLRMGLYRRLHGWIVEPWVLPRWMSDERIESERAQGVLATEIAPKKAGRMRAWFHAASVGELESLTPVLQQWQAMGHECIITVLSESARGTVAKLRDGSLYAGYAPWEGRWQAALLKTRPDVFVTAKYEAWPELWASLGELGIPLFIVSAKARRSLRWAAGLCRALGGKAPKLTLLTVRGDDAAELQRIFAGLPQVAVEAAGEPRWDRVEARAKQGNPRARELIERYRGLPKPWGVLAQVWPEDMDVWRGRFAREGGTLWVVPHRVDAESVARIERYLQQAGLGVEKTSARAELTSGVDCILVDEMGFLLELYAAADWAYVGGGFGVSMHSTIEPALFGIPVACGPEGDERFPEIAELRGTGQLAVVRDGEELDQWLEKLNHKMRSSSRDAERSRWKREASDRLGATQRIVDRIALVVNPRS